RALIHEGAAAGRHDLRTGFQKPRDDAPVQRAKLGLAVHLEDLRHTHPRHRRAPVTAVGEGPIERLAYVAADHRLAGPRQTDQHDTAAAETRAQRLHIRRSEWVGDRHGEPYRHKGRTASSTAPVSRALAIRAPASHNGTGTSNRRTISGAD